MNLVTYCSKNYSKLFFELFLPSWKKAGAKNIYVYTDCWTADYPGVEFINLFNPSTDWSINTGRRYKALKHYFENFREPAVFLDVDCFVVREIEHVFNESFDIGVTRLNSPRNKTASAGMVFFKSRSAEFIDDCLAEAKKNKSKGIGMRAFRTSYMQKGFDTVCKSGKYKIKNFDDDLYNSERDDLAEWYKVLGKYRATVKILHFKGLRGQDKKIVRKVFKTLTKNV